jgi:hypothetical protein
MLHFIILMIFFNVKLRIRLPPPYRFLISNCLKFNYLDLKYFDLAIFLSHS